LWELREEAREVRFEAKGKPGSEVEARGARPGFRELRALKTREKTSVGREQTRITIHVHYIQKQAKGLGRCPAVRAVGKKLDALVANVI